MWILPNKRTAALARLLAAVEAHVPRDDEEVCHERTYGFCRKAILELKFLRADADALDGLENRVGLPLLQEHDLADGIDHYPTKQPDEFLVASSPFLIKR